MYNRIPYAPNFFFRVYDSFILKFVKFIIALVFIRP